MLRHQHHTQPVSLAQPVTRLADDWATLILPRLPADLAVQAANLGAFQRARAFAQPADLLRGLLAYAVGLTSFRHLGAWGVLTELADLSAKGWCTRLRSASAWLEWLLKELLARRAPLRYLSQRVRGRINQRDCLLGTDRSRPDASLHARGCARVSSHPDYRRRYG